MLKNTLSLFALIFVANLALAQTANQAVANQEPAVEQVDKGATFPGGDAAIAEFVAKNQRNLGVKRSEVSTNEVVFKFIVETDGRISNLKCLAKPNTLLEEEAVMLLRKLGRWTPAEKEGKKVRSFVTQTIKLNLN